MTYYADLTPYGYIREGTGPCVYNVGWLDGAHPYPQGSLPPEFVAHLWAFCRRPLYGTRGIHICELCATHAEEMFMVERDGEQLLLGTAEIRVLGPAGRVYAAPDLIYHYVTVHDYRPPAEFVDAVLTGPWPGSPEYDAAIQQHGWEE